MAYNLERRQSPRKRFDHLLYVEVEPGNGGMVLNFSEHGFGFRAVKRVRPKEEVKFAVPILRTRVWKVVAASVGGQRRPRRRFAIYRCVRRIPRGDAQMDFGLGGNFQQISKNFRCIIVEWRISIC